MAGEGGKLEELGGSSERKAGIVGGFIGILLLVLMILLLVVVGVLLIVKGRSPLHPVNQPHKESGITSSMYPVQEMARMTKDELRRWTGFAVRLDPHGECNL
jgi:hypothetical protein